MAGGAGGGSHGPDCSFIDILYKITKKRMCGHVGVRSSLCYLHEFQCLCVAGLKKGTDDLNVTFR